MFWWGVTVRTPVLATAVRIDAVPKHDVGRTVFRNDGPGRVGQILDRPVIARGDIIGIPFPMFKVRLGMRRHKPIWRVDHRTVLHAVALLGRQEMTPLSTRQ